MKRIYSIDLFKLVFAYIIALGHFGIEISPGSGTTVQMFFIISGFFLARKFYSVSVQHGETGYNQWNYTLDHVKTLYPHYVFSLVILAVSKLAKDVLVLLRQMDLTKIGTIGKNLYALIPELFLLQNTGFFGGGINYPLWQVCALVISGYFVYGALCINEKRARLFVFPAAILMIQALLKTDVDLWGSVGCFHVPILRAISPMCIGVLTYYLTTTEYYEKIKKWHVLFNAAAVLGLVAIFAFGEYRNVFLITFPIVLLAMYDEFSWINKVCNRKLFSQFGTFSYAVYLNHALIIRVVKNLILPVAGSLLGYAFAPALEAVVYLAVVTVYSMLTLYIVNRFTSRRPFVKNTKGSDITG